MVGNGMGAKNGILFKIGRRRWRRRAASRSWRWTRPAPSPSGEPKVTDILPAGGVSEEELLAPCAYALEKQQRAPAGPGHPGVGARSRTSQRTRSTDFQALPGNGADGRGWTAKPCWAATCASSAATRHLSGGDRKHRPKRWPRTGKTPLCFQPMTAGLLGIIAVADVIKADSPQAVRELQDMGIHVVHAHRRQRAAPPQAIGAQAGVDEVIAGRAARRTRRASVAHAAGARARWPWWATASTTPRR